jgi:hypothetical protein
MHKARLVLLTIVAAFVAACSGGSDDSLVGGQTPTTPGGTPTVATLTLITSSPQLPSDGSSTATITALVRDTNNNVLANVPVIFQATSGGLVVSQPATTDANGLLTATLSTAGDPTNRTITVTGMAGTAQATVPVNVLGTTLSLSGPSSLGLGATGTYNVVLTNAGGVGIGNTSIAITSSRANGISQTPIFTDTLGRASFVLTANNGGADTLTAATLGMQATQSVNVAADSFTFTSPAVNTEVALGANVVVTARWLLNNTPVANRAVSFSTTRGTLSAGQVNTNASGDATVTVSATNAGPAVITATNADGTSVQLPIEFVATVPATLELQADPFTVPINDQSVITAIVRDPNGNLVKNQLVNFVLTDITGGSLSVAQLATNSQGRAQTFYNAGSTTSAVDGVRIDATVQGTAVTDFVNLTVARREVFITLGTGNSIEEPNVAQYKIDWVVQVTDAQGNGVGNVTLTASALSIRYWEGNRVPQATAWGPDAQPPAGCPDEDVNRNGSLDTGEDLNTSGQIEAGNKVTVTRAVGTGPIVTDANGFALISTWYPQEFAFYLDVALEVRTSVQGTEFKESTTFVLPGSATDFNNINQSPPGIVSPFGADGICATPN